MYWSTTAVFLLLISTSTLACSIQEILNGEIEESPLCNLSNILLNRLNLRKRHHFDAEEFKLPQTPMLLEGCENEDAICRVEGRRRCICPKSYVCDNISGSQEDRCAKLRFFQ